MFEKLLISLLHNCECNDITVAHLQNVPNLFLLKFLM